MHSRSSQTLVSLLQSPFKSERSKGGNLFNILFQTLYRKVSRLVLVRKWECDYTRRVIINRMTLISKFLSTNQTHQNYFQRNQMLCVNIFHRIFVFSKSPHREYFKKSHHTTSYYHIFHSKEKMKYNNSLGKSRL